jgi:hypothetical protein
LWVTKNFRKYSKNDVCHPGIYKLGKGRRKRGIHVFVNEVARSEK